MGSFAGLAEDAIVAEAHVVEDELARVGGTPHHLVVHGRLGESLFFVFDEQRREFRLAVLQARNSLHRGA